MMLRRPLAAGVRPEKYHSRGTGGYAQYDRSWETRTWNDETVAALKADMEANPGG